MGIMMSPSEEIEAIRLIAAPSRPRKAISVVGQGDNVIVKVSDHEVIIATKTDKHSWAFVPTMKGFGNYWVRNTLIALHKMKMISKGAVDIHTEHCRKRDEKSSKAYDLKAARRIAEQNGLAMPKSWENKLAPTN